MSDLIMKVVEFDDCWSLGGRAKYITDIVTYINKDKYMLEILTPQKDTNFFDSQLEQSNCKIRTILKEKNNPIIRTIKSIIRFKNAVNANKPDVIHFHTDNGFVFIYAYLSKKLGIKNVIVSCHNSGASEDYRIIRLAINCFGRLIFLKYADNYLACSELAAKWLYGKRRMNDILYFNYFIDLRRFMFNKETREKMRKEKCINDEVVFLFIGRFHYQKNPLFMLDVFCDISKKIECKLFMIGDGDLKSEMNKRVEGYGLKDKVFFEGISQHVEDYLCMADAFLLLSNHEGNPITVTEAQASGLPCFISEMITKSAKLLDSTHFVDISDSRICSNMILDKLKRNSDYERIKFNSIVCDKGYDNSRIIHDIEAIYAG